MNNVTSTTDPATDTTNWNLVETPSSSYLFYTQSTGLVVGGTITAGAVRGGTLTGATNVASSTESGGFIDLDDGTFLFGQRDPTGEFLRWDGTSLNLSGVTIDGATISGASITGGNITGVSTEVDLATNDAMGNTVNIESSTGNNISLTGNDDVNINASGNNIVIQSNDTTYSDGNGITQTGNAFSTSLNNNSDG